ncbi:peptidoglycan recognition family protein [Richelia sinica]|nr:peptidoglycan recognition family protein [Richelia sinica]MBD2666605.1 N-acetylmuramoyl-L-alanine amidase [Richelia sinica FACHB-800]
MRFRDWITRIVLIFLMLATLIVALFIGGAKQRPSQVNVSPPEVISENFYPQVLFQSERKQENLPKNVNKPALPPLKQKSRNKYLTTTAFSQYRPNLEVAAVDPTNYGERYTTDVNGLVVTNQPIIVIHETSNSATSAINFFQTPHEDENVQASYHTLIKLDGTVIYLVAPEKRAFGAANSVFEGAYGIETVQTNPNLPPSVNNFAYHVSLETPPDGRGDNMIISHSGYTDSQYKSLAWLIAQSQVPDERITTHKAVDRSGQRADPKSFDFDKLFTLLHTFRDFQA